MLPATDRNLRSFGFLMAGALVLVAGYSLWKRGLRFDALPIGLLAGATLFAALAAAAPRWLVVAYKPWMAMAHVLGQVMTAIIMTIFYFTFLVPFTFIRFKDPLRLSVSAKDETFWEPYKSPPIDLERFHRPF